MNIRLLWYRVPSLFQTLWLFPHFYLMIHLWEVSGWGGGGGFCDWETGQGWGSVELQRWNIWSRAERTTTTPRTIGRDNTGASLRQLGMSWCGVLTGSKSNTLKMKTVPSCKSSICSPHICVSGSSVWFCLPLLVLCVALRLWLFLAGRCVSCLGCDLTMVTCNPDYPAHLFRQTWKWLQIKTVSFNRIGCR